jgi:hypothetical protein
MPDASCPARDGTTTQRHNGNMITVKVHRHAGQLTLGRLSGCRVPANRPIAWASAPVAQGIEHLSPKEVAQVRILPGAPRLTSKFMQAVIHSGFAWCTSWCSSGLWSHHAGTRKASTAGYAGSTVGQRPVESIPRPLLSWATGSIAIPSIGHRLPRP